MKDLYDLESDGGWTSHQARVAEPTDEQWRQSYLPRRSAQVAQRAGYEVNPVNGHALDCACVKCPGWYEARARMAAASAAYAEPVVAPRQPRPMMDVVLPVAVLMMVFSLCAMVLLPVVMPFVAMGVALTGFIVICMCILGGLGLTAFGMFRRAARDAGAPVVRGRVLKRR